MLGMTVYKKSPILFIVTSLSVIVSPVESCICENLPKLASDVVPAVIGSSNLFTILSFCGPSVTAPNSWNGLDLSGGYGRGDGEEDESFHLLASLEVVQQLAGAAIRCLLTYLCSIPLQLLLNKLSFQGSCLTLAILY